MRKILAMMAIFSVTFGVALAQDTGTKETGSEGCKPATEDSDETEEEAEKQDDAEQGGIQFLHDLEEAKKQAVTEDKRLFIVFSTSWCGPCKLLKSNIWSTEVMAERVEKDFVPVYLDGDKEAAAKKLFNIKSYPTIILAENDCKVLATQVGTGGMMTPEAWSTWVDEQLGASSRLDEMLKAVEAEPQNAVVLRKLADAYYDLGRKPEAAEYYGKAEVLVEEELIQIKLRKAELLLVDAKEDSTVREVMNELIPKLIAKKDERVVDISLGFANLLGRMGEDKDPAGARKMMQDLVEAFPEHFRLIEFRCRAGMFAHMDGDNDTALTEMKAIAEDYKDSDDETIKVWVDRCHRFIKKIEEGGRYR